MRNWRKNDTWINENGDLYFAILGKKTEFLEGIKWSILRYKSFLFLSEKKTFKSRAHNKMKFQLNENVIFYNIN